MFARVSIFEGPIDQLEGNAALARERVVPALRKVEGSVGIIMLGDRSTGRSLGITLWESEEAMRASEEIATTMRTETADEGGEKVVGVERYQVFHEERW